MRYSIIIPTYNKCDQLLKPCVESILKYTTINSPDNAELIIVANGCTDNTEEYIKSLQKVFHNIAILVNPQPMGFTKAVNWGMTVARGEYFVIMNNDTILLNQGYNEWLEVLNRPWSGGMEMVGITGPMKVPNDSTRRPFLIFFCVMVSRFCYDKIGPMDEIFSPGYGEDTDWCLRAESMGFQCVQVPAPSNKYYAEKRMVGDFPIYHLGNQTFKDYPDAELIHRNNRILLERWGKLEEVPTKLEIPKLEGAQFREILKDPPYVEKIMEKYGLKEIVNISRAKKVDGYMADSELEWLATQAKTHKLIIEVGSWHGKSSRAIADNMMEDGILLCVDHWRGSETERDNNHQSANWEDGDHAYLGFLDSMWDLVGTKVHPVRLSSKNAAKYIHSHNMKANMIFIDAGHTYEEVKADIEYWLPNLEQGGLICGHDAFHVNNPWPGVLKAAKEKFGLNVKQAPNTSIWYVDDWQFITGHPVIIDLSEKPKRPPCVFDCFPFNNELEILEERFRTLYDHVDRFIIVEAMETHAGKPKELVFNANLERFDKYLNKVTYLVVESFPQTTGTVTDQSWARERYQRDYILNGLGDCQSDDIVMISDCDEIPTPEAIKKYKELDYEIAAFQMDLYYYNPHLKAKDKWEEAKITTYGKLKELGPCGIRYNKGNVSICDGGRHYSYFGGVDSIVQKIEDTAHQEYNQPQYKDKAVIFQRILRGEDVFGRNDIKFERV